MRFLTLDLLGASGPIDELPISPPERFRPASSAPTDRNRVHGSGDPGAPRRRIP